MTGDQGCPSRESLASFLLGKLPSKQEEFVALHLETCAACEALAQRLEQASDPLIDALRQPATASLSPSAPAPFTESSSAAPLQLEDYRILAEIGRGGMGVVYRAYQHRLNRLVAIKMILAGHLAGTEERVRFLMEGSLLARLNHPNFVQVYEVGTVEVSAGTAQPYLVLEHVEGGSLKANMAGKPLPFREAARQVLVLARAIEAAHAQGIIHRDLKPANVLIAADGTLKITDFGLAKELGTGASLTPAGITVGTPSYMAPEQARGGTALGPATDVYALGAILYEMLVGRPPFEGDAAMDVVLQVLHETPIPATRLRPGTPRDLETICLRCLEKEPRGRYHRAADLADDLENWLEGRTIRARPAGRIERIYKWARRHPLPAALLLFLFLSLVTGSAASTYFGVAAVHRANETQIALGKEKEATEAERWERYLSDISAASNALQLNNIGPARRYLEAAPAGYRNWEWRHFHSQLDGARSILRGHEDSVLSVEFSPDGKQLVSGSADESVRFWDAATGQQIRILRAPSGSLKDGSFSPNGSRVVTGGDRVRLWDAANGALIWEAEPLVPTAKYLASCPVWSNDGQRLVGTEGDDRVCVRDAATGHVVFTTTCNLFRQAIALSPDGRYVAFNKDDHTVRVCEIATGKELVLRGHKTTVTAIAYSPDGRRIATGSMFDVYEVLLWDAATGKLLGGGTGHHNEVSVLAFSPDGRHLASGSMDQTVRLWDGMTGEALATLRGHNDFVTDLAFSPNGRQLLSASGDQTLRLWDVAPDQKGPDLGRLITVLRGHAGGVGCARIRRDGAVIASGSADRTIRLWDAELVARNGVVDRHTNFVYDVAFRPDGAEAASSAWDHTMRRWDPTTGRPIGEPLRHFFL